ncbi:MAG TPA: phage tail protein [Haliscomenobacter sp.]|uniref:phage tail protein n=1 Tax=Haliscomenobacter sp. TaxID=2717303 RepID=UPI002C9C4913|nr:phage tail protein [Haliscomenobacter sp.]HOY17437.1 phage tail protein [Haliscomenobacter sp.]
MADTGKEQSQETWPIPTFHFSVKIGDSELSCQEVSGLDTEYDVVEYRNGNSPSFSVNKMPGLKKTSDVTIKKGMFKGDSKLYDYFKEVQMNLIERKTVTITLIDSENGSPLFVWTLTNAFPKKVTGASMNAKTSDASIEEIVLAHEGLIMAKG